MHHLCLVSDQPMPNFLPVLSEELKPGSVTLAVSPQKERQADALRREFESLNIDVRDNLAIADANDIAGIEKTIVDWLDHHEGEDVVLNLTGGTKPMAIAAQEAFRMADKPAFYVDIASDKALFLDVGRPPVQLSNQPTLGQFFRINGTTVASREETMEIPNRRWRELCVTLAGDIKRWAPSLALLNKCAMECEQDDVLNHARPQEASWTPCWDKLVTELYGNELVRGNGPELQFKSEEARAFCGGVWLEHYTFETIRRVIPECRNRAWRNIRIERDGAENELDAAFLSGNTLYIVECKTRNMRRVGVADNAIYKLAILSLRSGLRAKGVLVSANEVRPADKERAKALGIKVFDNLTCLEDSFRVLARR